MANEEIKVLPIAEELKKANLEFLGLSISHSSEEVIKVYVENQQQAEQVKNYLFAQGYKNVEIKIVGKIEPLIVEKTLALVGDIRVMRFMPFMKEKELVGGISIGGWETKTTGTLSIVSENIGITAWHVIPNDKNVIQPGAKDGGDISDKVGTFKEAYINKNIDLAVFEIDENIPRRSKYVKTIGEIIGYVEPDEVRINHEVEKYGRTSGYTKGRVIDKNVLVNITYPDGNRLIPNCYIIEPAIGLPGDSGSLVTRVDGYAIGLLIAGNSLITIVQHSEELKKLIQ